MAYDLLLERFLRYAKINTRSDENATRTPTTQSQVDFALNILTTDGNYFRATSNSKLKEVYEERRMIK